MEKIISDTNVPTPSINLSTISLLEKQTNKQNPKSTPCTFTLLYQNYHPLEWGFGYFGTPCREQTNEPTLFYPMDIKNYLS